MSILWRQPVEPTIAHRCKPGCMRPVTWRVADTGWWKQHEQGAEPVGITFMCCDLHVHDYWPVRKARSITET